MRVPCPTWLSRRIPIPVAAVVFGAAFGGCGTGTGNVQPLLTVRGPAPKVIPLRIRWSDFGARPIIYVRVGRGPLVPVLLDTGSTGLHIYTRGVRLRRRSGVSVTGRRDAATYGDGMTQHGVIARARLTIGSLTTVRPIRFGLIKSVGCVAEIPDCPGARGIPGRLAIGEYGILGIGLRRAPDKLANPLLSLPLPYARNWSVELGNTGGSLVLRPAETSPPVAQFPLARDGLDPSGARAWKDSRTRVCWATVDLRGAACEPTLFDSGSVTMLWYGGLLGRSDTSITDVLVNPGEYIAAWQPGSQNPFWHFTSGDEFSHDSVVALRGGHPIVIAAVQLFLSFDIDYDDAHGEIRLYRQSVP